MAAMNNMCEHGMCYKCKGGMKIVLGLLILANVNYLMWDWATFIGSVLVLVGIGKLLRPMCPHCK